VIRGSLLRVKSKFTKNIIKKTPFTLICFHFLCENHFVIIKGYGYEKENIMATENKYDKNSETLLENITDQILIIPFNKYNYYFTHS